MKKKSKPTNRIAITLRVSPDTLSTLQAIAERDGISQSRIVDRAVRAYAGKPGLAQ